VSAVLLEVAVTTVDDAIRAAEAGADRLELCSVLEVGGVTPSPETFLGVRAAVAIPVWVLVRPRPGGFHYSPGKFSTLRRDAEWFLSQGAGGIVVGALTGDNRIDFDRCAELARNASGRAAFHRAFDCIADRLTALDELIELGFRRVLTSGGAATAIEGADGIAKLIEAARGRIEVLPGGGVSPANVEELIRRTGCTQVHGSFRTPSSETAGAFGESRTTDERIVREVRTRLNRYARIASG